VKLLLANLAQVPRDKRAARFRCVIAIATPQGEAAVCEGECKGYITFEPRGHNGFGYDPVFLFPELKKTMAEMPPEMKGQISHRARAAIKVPAILAQAPFASL
jgi:XTP/dITP diphosphohydrolase